MAIEGEYRIGAPREAVWAALNDVDILKGCIPGCQVLTRLSDTEIEGRIQAQLGPVKAAFGTRLTLADINPPSGYTLSGEGKAAVGFGKGSAKVELIEEAGGTLLRYSATMQLGGKLAQLGSRLVEGATRQLADQFFEAFARQVDAGATAVPPAAAPAEGGNAPRSGAPGSWLRWVGIGGAVLLVWWLISQMS